MGEPQCRARQGLGRRTAPPHQPSSFQVGCSLSLAGDPILSQPCLRVHQADQNGPSSFVAPPPIPPQHLKDTGAPIAPRKGRAQT